MTASIVRRGARLLAGFALAAALAACSESPTGSGRFVSITTDRAEYTAGTRGTATITNVSSRPVYHGGCRSEVQRLTATGWAVVARRPEDEGLVCLAVVYTLQPGGSTTAEFILPANLPAGTYRVRFLDLGPATGMPPAAAQSTEPFPVEPSIAAG